MGPVIVEPEAILAALDDEQRDVATSLGVPTVVIAGAGTGKTRAITHRIAWGARTQALDPRAVLAVTFTTKAAGEMRERLTRLGVGQVQARTFHSAALRQIQFFWPEAYGVDLPAVTNARMGLVAEAARSRRLTFDTPLLRDLTAEVSWSKLTNVTADSYPEVAAGAGRSVGDLTGEQVQSVLIGYERVKAERNVIDFDDILLCNAALLSEHPDIAARVRSQYRHLVVDEYQDVSPLQHTVLSLWLGDSDDFCVVGDPNQAIHAFAGADAGFLNELASQQHGSRVIRLHRNYRSTPQVVELANRVLGPVSVHHGVQLQAQSPSGVDVTFCPASSEEAEAREVATWLVKMSRSGVDFEQMAVLFRINAQSPALEAALSELDVPYQVRGSERFYERAEVKQSLQALRAAAHVAQPAADIDGAGVNDRDSAATDQESGLEQFRAVLAGLGWSTEPPSGAGAVRERWESLNALANFATDLAEGDAMGLDQLVTELGQRASAQHAPLARGVTLSTMHAAKGQEWEAVAVTGVHEGTVPFVLATSTDQVAEERRLLFVAITRAKVHLRLSWSGRGNRSARPVSRFLADLLPVGVTTATSGPTGKRRRRSRSAQSATCRVCNRSLNTGADRKLGRHADCPSSYDEELFGRLRQWRKSVADAASVPAFVVFTDATLMAVAEAMPSTGQEMLRIPGVGQAKLERYGDQVLQILSAEA